MRPLWPRSSGQGDMEALQTDVMRFMAILGLCLAAIFSLVKSPDFTPVQPAVEKASTPPLETAPNPARLIEKEPTAPPREPTPAPPVSHASARSTDIPEPLHGTQPAMTTAAAPVVTPGASRPGTAEAAGTRVEVPAQRRSNAVPRETLEQGFQLVFASADDLRQLLTRGEAALYATDGARYWRWRPGGLWNEAASPGSYYRMERATLPDGFRQGAPAALSGTEAVWGIDLPAGIVRAIDRQMRDRSGGVLIIDGRGGVSVEPPAGNTAAASR